MKTTLNLDDALLAKAKAQAAQEQTSLTRLIEEGLAKGLLPQDGQTYTVLAQAHYFSDNIPGAIAAAQKGAPLAENGDLALFLASVLGQEDRNAESKAAGELALQKGLKNPGEAWMVIARAVIRDFFEGDDIARFISKMLLVTMLAPLLGPILGAQLLELGSWRFIFVFLTVASDLTMIFLFF